MFDAAEFANESVEQLKSTIDDMAIIACSGGVDSSVAAILAKRAAGDLLHCVYVDTGLMRKNETEFVEQMFAEQGIDLITVRAADRYFAALKGVTEPEQKRKIIGETFIRIFEDEQAKMLEMCRPKYFIPVHGEYRHMRRHGLLAEKLGWSKNNILNIICFFINFPIWEFMFQPRYRWFSKT